MPRLNLPVHTALCVGLLSAPRIQEPREEGRLRLAAGGILLRPSQSFSDQSDMCSWSNFATANLPDRLGAMIPANPRLCVVPQVGSRDRDGLGGVRSAWVRGACPVDEVIPRPSPGESHEPQRTKQMTGTTL
jgi:hypothetical protein